MIVNWDSLSDNQSYMHSEMEKSTRESNFILHPSYSGAIYKIWVALVGLFLSLLPVTLSDVFMPSRMLATAWALRLAECSHDDRTAMEYAITPESSRFMRSVALETEVATLQWEGCAHEYPKAIYTKQGISRMTSQKGCHFLKAQNLSSNLQVYAHRHVQAFLVHVIGVHDQMWSKWFSDSHTYRTYISCTFFLVPNFQRAHQTQANPFSMMMSNAFWHIKCSLSFCCFPIRI